MLDIDFVKFDSIRSKMEIRTVLFVLSLVSLSAVSTSSFAKDSALTEPQKIRYFTQVTRSDAKKFPFQEGVPLKDGEVFVTGKNFQDPEAIEAMKKMAKDKKVAGPTIPLPMMYTFSIAPTVRDGKILITGTLLTFSKDRKFLKQEFFRRLLDKNEVTTFNIEAGGYKWEVNMKFTY